MSDFVRREAWRAEQVQHLEVAIICAAAALVVVGVALFAARRGREA